MRRESRSINCGAFTDDTLRLLMPGQHPHDTSHALETPNEVPAYRNRPAFSRVNFTSRRRALSRPGPPSRGRRSPRRRGRRR